MTETSEQEMLALAEQFEFRGAQAHNEEDYGEARACKVASNALRVAATRAAGDAPVVWQPIETAPKMKEILLFAITDEDEQGNVRNWKMASGAYYAGYEDHEKLSPWSWDGRRLAKYEIHPTHWQPLPAPPVSRPDSITPTSALSED